ncbi:hypothetical protein KIW84_055882, partial [Lathyrus oleraceus]
SRGASLPAFVSYLASYYLSHFFLVHLMQQKNYLPPLKLLSSLSFKFLFKANFSRWGSNSSFPASHNRYIQFGLATCVERWHSKTSYFHLSIREVAITLDDVS